MFLVQWCYYVLSAVIGIAGLFITFAGHRFFLVELLIMGFLSGLLVGVIILLIAQVSLAGM